MKIKVEVDLSEMYDEGEEISFSESIKQSIAYQVKSQVFDDFKKSALDYTVSLVREEFEKSKQFEINKIVSEIISNRLIKKSENKGVAEMITLKDFIEERITNDYFNERNSAEGVLSGYIRSFDEKFKKELKDSSDKISKELKDRYDLLFASQIVSKLNENGMLNEDVAKKLLTQ